MEIQQNLYLMVRYKNEMAQTSTHWILNYIRIFIEALFRCVNGDKAFYKTDEIPWVQDFEQNHSIIREELLAIIRQDIYIPDWESISNDPSVKVGKSWNVFMFKGYGTQIDKNCILCPQTSKMINKYPIITTAWFSILKPQKEIPIHRGPYNGVLRYHLGLLIPSDYKNCGIMVKDTVRHWEEGKSLLFDDTHLHKAWNHTDELRVVLFMDIIRPLPFPLNILNKTIIRLIQKTPYVQNILNNLVNEKG